MITVKRTLIRFSLAALLLTSTYCSQEKKSIKTANFEFFQETFTTTKGREIEYNIIKINHKNTYTPKIVTSKEALQLQQMIPNAALGINAAFFTPKKQNIGILKSQDSLLNTTPIGSKNKGYLTHNKKGYSIDTIPNVKKHDLVLESFPLLEYNNISRIKTKNSFHQRSAVAIDKDKNLYLIVTDNSMMFRNKISFFEFKEFLESKNYVSVLNLDGGSSAQLKVKNSFYQKGRKIHAALGFYEK